jgi:glycosyltransferase involved in cell wall biosynthesis
MKLIVQIPCFNEQDTLALVLETIPKKIKGITEIVVVIIDDGCSDETVKIAKQHGVTHFVHHRRNMGLARSFRDGVDYALELGADIVVNTDGDNQYPQEKIADLVQPILNGKADIVVADRQTHTIEHFSPLKKILQQFGSWIVNKAADTNLPDAASGFRAYSRTSLLRLNIVTEFSYCMETIIQAGHKRMAITSIPIKTNAKTRESRLFKNMWQHIFYSSSAIIRSYLMYKPNFIFINGGIVLFIIGIIPFIRYIILLSTHTPGNHIQSLLLGVIALSASFLCFTLAIIADLIRINRILHEEQLEQQRAARFVKVEK